MASAAKQTMLSAIPPADLQSFTEHLKSSRRILALLGAGLSASSGLPTFRGAGGLWRSYNAVELATPGAFKRDPGLVWQFYNYRRHMSLQVEPNKAHYALAELSRKKSEFITLSQNVDGLSQRAQHPPDQLHLLHGTLFDIKCSECDYVRKDDFTDPVVPALEIPKQGVSFPAAEGQDSLASASTRDLDISDEKVPIPDVNASDLPHCPECNALLRPGVVWFGESLPEHTLNYVDKWIDQDDIDLMLVIGTSSVVHPAADYTWTARDAGARIAVINMDENDVAGQMLEEGDWFFKGDAAVIVPEILKSVIGEI